MTNVQEINRLTLKQKEVYVGSRTFNDEKMPLPDHKSFQEFCAKTRWISKKKKTKTNSPDFGTASFFYSTHIASQHRKCIFSNYNYFSLSIYIPILVFFV